MPTYRNDCDEILVIHGETFQPGEDQAIGWYITNPCLTLVSDDPPAAFFGKNNMFATSAPTVNDDLGGGYNVGSMWIDRTADKVYTCVDETIGAAVWEQTGGTGADDQTAAEVPFTPAGDIVETDTQGAVVGVDARKIPHADFTAADEVMVGTGAGTHGQVTLGASQFLAKKAAGAVTNITAAEARTILNVEDGAEANNISDVDATDLTDGGDTTLHDHDGISENTAARHTQGTDIALGAVAAKNPPIDADKALYRDSTVTDALVTSTWTQIKAFLKTYFDSLYSAISHKDTHDPEDGGDKLDTATASEIAGVQAAAVGTSHSLARADHVHAINHGITDNHLLTVDQADAADDEYARFTTSGIESRSVAETKTDMGYMTDLVDDTTPQLGGDLDAQGNYAVGLQNIPDLAAKGPGFWFDGVNDYIDYGNKPNLAFESNQALSMVAILKLNPGALKTTGDIISKGNQNTPYQGYAISVTIAGNLTVALINTVDTNNLRTQSLRAINDGMHHCVGVTYNGSLDSTGVSMYIDGDLTPQTVLFNNLSGSLLTAFPFNVGARNSVEKYSYGSGAIYKCLLFNLVLTETEVKAFSSGAPVPFKYIGASQTALTSGTLIVGKQYIIDTFVAGDNFVNVGGTNVTGNTFVATGITPTTWTNSSSLRRIGAVLQLENDSIMNGQWLNKNPNLPLVSGTVNGALTTNLPTNHKEQFIQLVNMTDDTAWLSVVPANYILNYIVFEGTNANACIVDLGTTTGNSDVFSQQTIVANGFTTVVLNKFFSKTTAQSLYLSDDGVGVWNGASVLATLYMSKIRG